MLLGRGPVFGSVKGTQEEGWRGHRRATRQLAPSVPDVLSFPSVFTWTELGWQVTVMTQCWQAMVTKCCQPGESRPPVGAKKEVAKGEGWPPLAQLLMPDICLDSSFGTETG